MYRNIQKKNNKRAHQRDLPLPVAMTTKQSLPSRIFSMTSSWYGRNDENPKYFCTPINQINHELTTQIKKINKKI